MGILHSDKKAIDELMQIIGEHGHYKISMKTNKHAIDIIAIGERTEHQDFLLIIKLCQGLGLPCFSVEKVRRIYQHAEDYKPEINTILHEKRYLKPSGLFHVHRLFMNQYFHANAPQHGEFLKSPSA